MSEEIFYAGSDWLKKEIKYHKTSQEVSEFGGRIADLLGELFHGIYHINKEVMHPRCNWDSDEWIEIVLPKSFSTHDFDELTRLVILCHKYKIRCELEAAAPGYIRLVFYSPNFIFISNSEHPGIDELIEKAKKNNPR